MPRRPRALVVTIFEGEFAPWRANPGFVEHLDSPTGHGELLYDPHREVLCAMTGVGTAAAAASMALLGTDPRFDLTQAYILVAGIAGGDPDRVSAGSVAWAEWVVDSDLAMEIDSREIPEDWASGRIPLFRQRPFETPPGVNRGEVHQLNGDLVTWAADVTRSVTLLDTSELEVLRREYVGFSGAGSEPGVIRGDTISGSTLWHGARLNAWARQWVEYWTEGRGHFVTTSMEDSGIMSAIGRLATGARVDPSKVLLLRSVCNYSVPPSGWSASRSLAREKPSGYSAMRPAVENAYRVASAAVDALI